MNASEIHQAFEDLDGSVESASYETRFQSLMMTEIAAQIAETNQIARLRLRWEVAQIVETGTVKGNSENEFARARIHEEAENL